MSDEEQDYEENVRRLNAFCEKYVDNLDQKLQRIRNEKKREKLMEKLAAVRSLTIPLFLRRK